MSEQLNVQISQGKVLTHLIWDGRFSCSYVEVNLWIRSKIKYIKLYIIILRIKI